MALKGFGKSLCIDVDEVLSVQFISGGGLFAHCYILYKSGLRGTIYREKAVTGSEESFDAFHDWCKQMGNLSQESQQEE